MRSRRHVLLAACMVFLSVFSGCTGDVKEPSVAGYFYPAEKETLTRVVEGFLSDAENRKIDGRLIALISPHAGYRFSGAVAAHAYKHIQTGQGKSIILIGPSHHKSFRGVSVYREGSFRTPLGIIKVDSRIANSLINTDADISFYRDAFAKEHSLEVQLPFLQRVLTDFRIVPILIGMPTKKSFEFLTKRLIEILSGDENTLLVASTDLSHYHEYHTAVKMDGKTIDAIERMALEDVERYLVSGEGEMCGAYPVLYTMAVARGLGATESILFKYANSGDVTGDRERVVGYAAIGLYRSELKKGEKERLLSLARESIIRYVMEGDMLDVDLRDRRLRANGATFVTINKHGNLRGCIGNIYPSMPLYKSVINNAVSACSMDQRFPPLRREELKDVEVEISVLSPFEPLHDIRRIEIGKHGLYLIKGHQRGLLLPQVAAKNRWDRKTFLEHVSQKAGLPEDAWKTAQLFVFTAEIIR